MREELREDDSDSSAEDEDEELAFDHDSVEADRVSEGSESSEESSSSESSDDDLSFRIPPKSGSACGSVDRSSPGAAPPNELATAFKDKRYAEKVRAASNRFRVGYADTIGMRPSMEDRLVVHGSFRSKPNEDYFAVFDGHGGPDAAAVSSKVLHVHLAKQISRPLAELEELYAQLRARLPMLPALEPAPATPSPTTPSPYHVQLSLKLAFMLTQLEMLDQEEALVGGTTALVALATAKHCYLGNLGDSRAVLVRANGVCERLTRDHKPHDEEEETRIKAQGGFVTKHQPKGGVMTSRVCGALAVSRSLGDFGLKDYLTCEPDIFSFELKPAEDSGLSPPRLLIMACDGLWDVVSDADAAKLALAQLGEQAAAASNSPSALVVEEAAVKLRDRAYGKGSSDNITVVVVAF